MYISWSELDNPAVFLNVFLIDDPAVFIDQSQGKPILSYYVVR